jgi:serine phosphatase RsbU (regulator of sigma subunit)
MTQDHGAHLLSRGLTVALLGLLVAIDVAIPGHVVVLVPLFALPPLVAAAVLPPLETAALAVLGLGLTVLSAVWNDTWWEAQQTVRVIDVALIAGAAVAVAAIRVHREARFAEMTEIAEAAQRAILPKLPAVAAQVAIAARYESAAQGAMVGGDLYDCYHSDVHTRFLVGDVRGKGIGGVEQAARVIRAFRQSAATRPTLAEVAREMTEYLVPFFEEEEFVTALLVEVTDPRDLTMVSAGHPPPALVRDNGHVELVDLPPGLPLGLGLGEAGSFTQVTVPWGRGDRLLMYTDGLSEARDATGSFLQVTSLAPALRVGTVDGALDEMLDRVGHHVPRGRLNDDLAVVLLENVALDQPSMVGGAGSRATRAEYSTAG